MDKDKRKVLNNAKLVGPVLLKRHNDEHLCWVFAQLNPAYGVKQNKSDGIA